VVSLQNVYRRAGREVLDRALGMMIDAGMTQDEPLSGEILVGIALLLSRYDKVIDTNRLERTLEEIIPRRIVAGARAWRSDVNLANSTLHTAVARLLLERYNKGLRTGRVEWHDASARDFWRAVSTSEGSE
jgi:hypothetical protein